MITGPIAQGNDMQPGEVLNPNQSISSTNIQYTFIYQGDGNLVLYRNQDGKALWNSQTAGKPVGVCIMQGDGNLVIYQANGGPVWDSKTYQHPGSRLVVRDDGNVAIFATNNTPVWTTNLPLNSYNNLRAAVLSRHFAISRYFRKNFFSEGNNLITTLDPNEILAQDTSRQKIERWRIEHRGGENPLMFGGLLLVSLAVEAHMGNSYSLKILKKALVSLSTLYKFKGNNFDGYIIRWDPVSSEEWWQEDLQYSNNFLIGGNNNYLWCAPPVDPRYFPYSEQKNEEWYNTFFHFFRRVEPSMDELVGLVAAYSMIAQLVKDPTIQALVTDQANKLADYLNAHGFILVRPYGGFSARGASGILPAFEYPFNRVFNRITKKNYGSVSVSFEDAMKKANVWKCLEGPTMWWSIAGIAAAVLLNVIFRPLVYVGVALTSSDGKAFLDAITNGPVILARAKAIIDTKTCFDTNNDYRGEFPVAYLLKQVQNTQSRFTIWQEFAALGTSGSPATAFPPFIALTALDDSESTVKESYLSWLNHRRIFNDLHKNDNNSDHENSGAKSLLSSAVALLLGAGVEEEKKFVALLNARYNELHEKYRDDIPLIRDPSLGNVVVEKVHATPVSHPDPAKEISYAPSALDYIVGLSLAFLYSKRRADSGKPVTTEGFPFLSDGMAQEGLSKVTIPKEVLRSANENGIKFRIIDIQNTTSVDTNADADLFTDAAPEKSIIPNLILPPFPNTELPPKIERMVEVRESYGDVYTGIVLDHGDVFEFSEISGSIWSGVLATGWNDPNGWNNVDYDTKFPLHAGLDPVNAHPYCLLGMLNNYFFIGSNGRGKERFLYRNSLPLYLRINDDVPGNGDGEFNCRIKVWGKPIPLPAFLFVKVQPYPIKFRSVQLEVTATFTVYAEDKDTHAQIQGRVIIDGKDVGSTNTPLTYTFKRTRFIDPVTHTPIYNYSKGRVTASGYSNIAIDFGFDE